MAILRQLLESACHAICYQALVSSISSRFLNSPFELCKFGLIVCEDLEGLLIAITCINGKQLKKMEAILEKRFLVSATCNSKECDVPNDKLFAMTRFLAKEFDKSEFCKGLSLRPVVSRLHKSYKFLCQFLHPTPLLYPISVKYGGARSMPRDEDRELVAAITFLETLEGIDSLLSELLFARRLQIAKFGELCFLTSFASQEKKTIGYVELPIIQNFMSRYKNELVFDDIEGPITVFSRKP